MGIRDGLGAEEITGSEANLGTQNAYVNGTLTTVGATSLLAGVAVTGSAVVSGVIQAASGIQYTTGSPWKQGTYINVTARANITGGMWVSLSGGLAYPAAALTQAPVGVCTATVASGGTASIMVHGIYPFVSEGTITSALGVKMGAGGALNTVAPVVAGSAKQFAPLSEAGSEGVIFVLL